MADSLGKKALSGVMWKFAERMAAQGVTTVVGIILARILDPQHYGVIAIVNIFITICNVFVVTGLGESLIQKKDADDMDFSSIFYINVGMSVLLYVMLFIAAPYITAFYGEGYESLTLILRVMGIRLILAAINSIQHAKIAREFAFRKYFFVTLVGTILSAFVGVSLAYYGAGVWALVAQYMTNTTVDTIMLFLLVQWVPKLQFSMERVKGLVGYGTQLLSTALFGTIAGELEQMLIGKMYTASDLAFYTKGNTYPKLLANNISVSISSAIFPLFSKTQDDKNATKKYVGNAIQMIGFVIFPILLGLALVAEDFVSILLTDKWLPCVPYLRIMCAYYIIYPLIVANSQCLTATGHVKLYAKITYAVRVIGLIVLFISVRYGVVWIALSKLIVEFIEYIIKTLPTKKMLGYGFVEQLIDMLPSLLGCIVMSIVVFSVRSFTGGMPALASFALQILSGGLSYLFVAIVSDNPMLKYLINLVHKRFK